MRNLIVLGGSSHPQLTRSICRNLTIEQAQVDSKKFSNGETSIEIEGSVREKDVFIIQSGCGDVNDNFIELLIMIAACKTASAKRVTAVLPLFPYSRQPDVPHAASLTGAPSITTKKDQYTFESAPSTPRPLSRGEKDSEARPSSPSPIPSAVSRSNSQNSGQQNSLLGKATLKNSIVKQPTPVRNTKVPAQMPMSIVTNSAATNVPQVDVYGKTESGYKQWIAQNGTLVANLLTTAGADRCITMDLHDPQFQGFFDIPVDNLYSKPLLRHYIADYIPNYQDCVIVSPDSGGAKRATAIADVLGCSFALIHKERRAKVSNVPPSTSGTGMIYPNGSAVVATTMLVGNVKDRVCVLIDDLVDTSYTITRAAKLLKNQGAKYVYALIPHGVFSGDSINRINKSDIDKIVVTNSVPQGANVEALNGKLEVLDVSRVLAESIRRIHNGESISMLFDYGW
ncbi:Piso0_005223 [Millerozyma farinosa CBS 7064]|uniref:ribose-phosphate diphosphokinase n=1 Tax=Pichia sorbitophila (strain ATCC MYA-4447 / BCRC 22081 / CBS 7064 / NBRC 10061 / NRRL Y-12695) TaxID=559304 RepID=G8Y4J1_PICSO|nr:Piso0_005223 [Millerozyma farinosa CBS 7064]